MTQPSVFQKTWNLLMSIQRGTVLIATVLFVLAAIRNSITWHLQNFWGLSHDFWQELWITYRNFCGNDLIVYVLGVFMFGWIPFVAYNTFLGVLDLYGKPSFLKKYKIQPNVNTTVSWSVFWKTALTVLLGQVFVASPVILCFYKLQKWNGISYGTELPTFQRVLFELFGCIGCEEILFYYSHRLLHHPLFYSRFHKMHHEWKAPIGITSVYAHPVEIVFSNTLPVMVGSTLFCSHVATVFLWFSMVMLNTTNAHSGYHFPSFPSNEAHDYHHLKFNECFGLLGILDRIHGTNNKFRASQHYQRHRQYFSTTPMRLLIPDPAPKSPTGKRHAE